MAHLKGNRIIGMFVFISKKKLNNYHILECNKYSKRSNYTMLGPAKKKLFLARNWQVCETIILSHKSHLIIYCTLVAPIAFQKKSIVTICMDQYHVAP